MFQEITDCPLNRDIGLSPVEDADGAFDHSRTERFEELVNAEPTEDSTMQIRQTNSF